MSLISGLCRQNETMRAARRGPWRRGMRGTARRRRVGKNDRHARQALRHGRTIGHACDQVARSAESSDGGGQDISGHWRRILLSGTVRPAGDVHSGRELGVSDELESIRSCDPVDASDLIDGLRFMDASVEAMIAGQAMDSLCRHRTSTSGDGGCGIHSADSAGFPAILLVVCRILPAGIRSGTLDAATLPHFGCDKCIALASRHSE